MLLQALHAFCLSDVTLCIPHNDPASFVRCLAPYLKVPPTDPAATPHEKRRGAERLLCILSIISSLLGKLDRLPPEAAQDLENDLVQLINAHHYVQVNLQCFCSCIALSYGLILPSYGLHIALGFIMMCKHCCLAIAYTLAAASHLKMSHPRDTRGIALLTLVLRDSGKVQLPFQKVCTC